VKVDVNITTSKVYLQLPATRLSCVNFTSHFLLSLSVNPTRHGGNYMCQIY